MNVNFNWTLPIQKKDNTPLDPSTIAFTRVMLQNKDGSLTTVLETEHGFDLAGTIAAPTDAGDYQYVGAAVDTHGQQGDLGPIATITIPEAVTSPPAALPTFSATLA